MHRPPIPSILALAISAMLFDGCEDPKDVRIRELSSQNAQLIGSLEAAQREAAEANQIRAEANDLRKQVEGLAAECAQLQTQLQAATQTPETAYRIAVGLAASSSPAEAAEIFKSYVERFPDAALAKEALLRIEELEQDKRTQQQEERERQTRRMRSFLTSVIIRILYPGVVLLLIGYIVFVIARIVKSSSHSSGWRPLLAAAIPVIMLIFVLVPDEVDQDRVIQFFGWPWPDGMQFCAGMVLAIFIVEVGRKLTGAGSEPGRSVYSMVLSMVLVFVIYCFIAGQSAVLHFFLFGSALGGGLDMVFRGPPLSSSKA